LDETVRNSEGLRKLHIGPGNNYIPDWVNVDIFSNVRADIYSSALALPYERETFDIIYVCHVLEHFTRHFVLSALTHWRDLLKPTGILRISVPDFGAICRYYTETMDLRSLIGLLYGGQNNLLNNHLIAFDEITLSGFLYNVGFKDIRLWDWRTTEHAQFDDYSQAYLPAFQKDTGRLMSLNMEATK